MGTKRLLYIFLPPDETHYSDGKEATLLFLKLFCFYYVDSKLIKVTDIFYCMRNTWLLLSIQECIITDADLSPSLLRAPYSTLPSDTETTIY